MENEYLWREVGRQLEFSHSMINRLQNRYQPTGSTAKKTYSLINIHENYIFVLV